MKTKFSVLAGILLVFGTSVHATVDDSLSFAYESAAPSVKQGFTMREDAWGGDLGVDEQRAVPAYLYAGNEYCFLLASNTSEARLSVYIYDLHGKLLSGRVHYWQKANFAGAQMKCDKTGQYWLIITVNKSPEDRTNWALVYGYR